MFEKFAAILVAGLILAVIFMASKLREYYREKKLKALVSWAVLGDTLTVCGHDMPLWMYVHNAQIDLGIQEEYRISSDEEWQFVKEIIQGFQNHLMQSYFKDQLGIIQSKYVIRGEHYFMFALGGFLEEHHCDYKFLGYDMHKERVNYKEYGSWGGTLYDATYAITNFSIVYHKLYYIVYMFCKNCKPLNESGLLYGNEKFLKEILETKQIQLSRY